MGVRSEINAGVPPANQSEFTEAKIGTIGFWPPVILAPMAGVTNAPFRTLCREHGAGLYVSEMITARGLAEGNTRSEKLSRFATGESPRSIQLYGVDPISMEQAVLHLIRKDGVDHIDLNFGCPMPKVTRHGGGAAIPLRPKLYASIVGSAVSAAGDIPVTVKFRLGTDSEHLTFLQAGKIAEELGASALSLHARTAEQLYSGTANWSAIGDLKASIGSIPVFGNGDIWEPWDALRLMRTTGCDGVVIGRGCLGRPWIFGHLATVFGKFPNTGGAEPDRPPRLGTTAATMKRHARLLTDWAGPHGIRDFRKHTSWYLKGYSTGPAIRHKLKTIESLSDLNRYLGQLDSELELGLDSLRAPRSHRNGPKRVVLPNGWLNDLENENPPGIEAEVLVSGG